MISSQQLTGDGAAEAGDTRVHVARLLQEPVGSTRQRTLAIPELALDDEQTADEVAAELRLTRIPAGILAEGHVRATVTLECIRCLEEFEQAVDTEFADEYRPTIDIATGRDLDPAVGQDEDDYFSISDTHVLDTGESLRQAILLALPMAPRCREDCAGLGDEQGPDAEAGDDRFAVLGQLLQPDGDEDQAAQPKRARRNAAR